MNVQNKAKRQHNGTVLFICFLLLGGLVHVAEDLSPGNLQNFLFILLFTIYVGLILFWIEAVRRRLLPSAARSCMAAAGIMMLLFLVVRTMKYRILTDVPSARLLWYAYYVPFLLIPTLFLLCSISFAGTKKKSRHLEYALLTSAILLSLLMLTNDLHHFAFLPSVPNEVFDGTHGTYSYGFLFYAVYGWAILCVAVGVVFLIRASRKLRDWRKTIQPSLAFAMIPVLAILMNYLDSKGMVRIYQVPEIFIFCLLGVFESCIQNRLVMSNMDYPGFFSHMGFPVTITDNEVAPVYTTAKPITAARGEFESALHAPVYLTENTRLDGKKLRSGYAFWTTDETGLHRMNANLSEANELLSEENDLIRTENELKEKKARLDAQNRVYDRIAYALYPTQKKIEALLRDVTPGTPEHHEALARCCVLNAYSKRKSNLLLRTEDTLTTPNRELFLCLQESVRFMGCCGVEAAAVGEEESDFPLSVIHDLYDTFETLIEALLPNIRHLTVHLTKKGIRLVVDAVELAPLPKTKLPVSAYEDEGFTYFVVTATEGGAA